jgi:acyl-CoA synthetase (AMP-forming)/AMP-acid ligase II
MNDWSDLGLLVRREAHFGDRLVNCFADRPSTYFEMVTNAVRQNPDGEALISGDTRLTWKALEQRSLGFAKGLLRHGARPKDRILFYLGNRIEFVVALLACARIGVIIVPVNIREQKDALKYLLDHSGAVAILHEAGLSERLPSKGETPSVRLRIATEACAGSIAFAEVHEDGEITGIDDVKEEDVFSINYTSGTTGLPKGVTFSHIGVIHAAMHYSYCIGLTSADRSVLSIPLSFTGGMISALSPMIYAGGAVVVLPEFKAVKFLQVAAEERMTHTLMVPAMYELCLRQPDVESYDLTSWKYGVFGAAPMPAATVVRLAQKFPNLLLMNSYGATEAGGPSTFMRARDTAANPDAVGQAFPCVELAVMDEEGRELPLGSTGELWIRSPSCSAGFWNDPDRTAAEYFGGYWRSGDIATLSQDGLVRLVDRKKDMINRGGYKISSTQVEEVLYAHPSVIECAVVGRPDDVLGERVQAFVWTDGALRDDAVLKEFCAERLPDYKVPELIDFTTSPLPRNANGKILKRVLRQSIES